MLKEIYLEDGYKVTIEKEDTKLAKNNQKREKAERNKLNASKYSKKNNRNSRFRNN